MQVKNLAEIEQIAIDYVDYAWAYFKTGNHTASERYLIRAAALYSCVGMERLALLCHDLADFVAIYSFKEVCK